MPVDDNGPIHVETRHLRPERLRVFVLAQGSAKPAPGVPVAVVAGVESSSPGEVRRVPVAFLQSDGAGYLSCDLAGLAQSTALRHVWLRPFDDAELEVDAFPVLDAGADPAIVTLTLPSGRDVVPRKWGGLPSVPAPDVLDWRLSPGSFVNQPTLRLGEGACEELLHSRQVEGAFRFVQLVRDGEAPALLEPADGAPCEGQGDEFSILPSRCYRLGALLEYEVTWEPLGHGLGRVVYSLALAPCESVRIVVIDWRRTDEVSRAEDTSVAETLSHVQTRERDIEETVRATLTEKQLGGSFMGGGAISGKSSSLGGTGALGGGVSGSRGSRRLAASTAQHLADEIVQTSSALRRLNSTVVVQASQAEQETLQTRTVANHNHCHALTVLYYEVVRHYRVRVRLVHKQDVIYVRYGAINDMQEPFEGVRVGEPGYVDPFALRFTPRVALRYRTVLEPVLLDPLLRPCFAALAKLYCAERAFERRPRGIPAEDFDLLGLQLRFTTGAREASGDVRIEIETMSGTRIRTNGPAGEPEPLELDLRDFPANSETLVRVTPERRLRWGNVAAIVVHASRAWELTHILARTQRGSQVWTLLDTAIEGHDFAAEHELRLEVSPFGPATPQEVLTPAEQCCVDGLIEHLNVNRTYYARAVWVSQDAEERARAFERYAFRIDGETGSRLTDFLENRVVGVTGDYVAFPLTVSRFADELVREGEVTSERIVTLPTRGLFAETKLSTCNACEARDVTRYWDWTESPCPCPPEIAPVEAGGRAQEVVPATTPTTLPSPVVTVVTPPAAPDPVGLAAALKLLGTPDIFRDMSMAEEVGALVRDLATGSVTLTQAQERARELQARGGGGAGASGGDASGAGARSTPTEVNDRTTVATRAIEHGREAGALSDDEANALFRRLYEQIIASYRERGSGEAAADDGDGDDGGE